MIESGDGSSREVSAEAGMETSRRAERRKMSVEEYHGAASPRNPRAERRKQSPGGSGSHRNSPRGRSSKGAGRRNYLPPKDENGKFAALASNVDAHDEPLYTLPGEDEGGGRRGSILGGKIADAAEAAAKKIADTAKESGGKIFGAVMGLFTKEEESILTKEEKKQLKANFDMIDVDGGGSIGRDEFKAAMMVALVKHPDKPPLPDDETLQKEFDLCDIDGNGTIELDEFYTCFANLKGKIGNQEARDKFAVAAIPSYLPAVEESWSNNGRWMINGRGSSYMQGVAANVKAKETSFETSVSPRTWDERNS